MESATWEDEDVIRPLLNSATAPGHDVVQEEGNVMVSTPSIKIGRPRRERKNNPRVHGFEWAV